VLSEGGGAAEGRVDGGGELVGVHAGRRRCSAAWERGKGKRARGMGLWGSFIARAHVRRGRQALPGAIHGGVAVAAVWMALEAARVRGTAWEHQREEGGRWGGSGATRRCQREAKAKSELACGRSSAAAGGAVGGKQRSRQAKEEDRDLNAISKNFRDQTVKP